MNIQQAIDLCRPKFESQLGDVRAEVMELQQNTEENTEEYWQTQYETAIIDMALDVCMSLKVPTDLQTIVAAELLGEVI